jgi:predicted nucleic acid-binding protein
VNVVVDANVVVKWYVSEADSAEASLVLEQAFSLVAPGHALGEIGEVLARRCQAGDVSREQVNRASDDLLSRLALVPTDSIFEPAFDIALGAGISFYDALYVALADELALPLVTADAVLVRRLAATRWSGRIVLLADWPAVIRTRQ